MWCASAAAPAVVWATASAAAATGGDRRRPISCVGVSITGVFDPGAASVLSALEAFMQVLMSNAEDAGFESLMDSELTFSQARTIMVLGQSGEPLPIKDLAARIQLSVAAAGRNVEQLVRAGLVDRVEDGADRRIKRVSLSAKGREQIGQFVRAKRSRALTVLEGLSPDDRVRLLAAFTPILATFGTATCFPEEIAP